MSDLRTDLTIVLPAFNEAANIIAVIDQATAVAERLCVDHEIIVVDDGSTDRTAELVRARSDIDDRVRLVQHASNRGYGEAVRTGFESANRDLVFFTDADQQFDLNELDRFLPWIDRVEVVAGYREDRQDPFMRRVNGLAWNYLVRVLFYVPVRDIDCAFKLFRRSVFDEIEFHAIGAMVNTELMVKVGRSGYGVVEVPVTHLPRKAGKARGANPRVILRAFIELFTMYRRLKSADGTVRKPRASHAAREA